MQKKIIALAIATAMAAPAAAMAEVTVYGQVNMAYEMTDTGTKVGAGSGVGTAAEKRNQVSSNASRLGLKGSEDMGSGMTAVWQMEAEVDMDTGDTTVTGNRAQTFNRNTYVGVAGGFGTVVLGNHDTPYKMSTRKLDVFADSIADNRNIMGGGAHDARLTDVVAYLTPNFDGFSAAIAMVGKTDNTLSGFATHANSVVSATSLSLNYARDNWTVALANQSVEDKAAAVVGAGAHPDFKATYTATKLAGSYAMDAFTVGMAYEMLEDKVDGAKTTRDNIYIGATYKVSDAGKVKLSYTMAGESKDVAPANKDSASQISIGYDHAMTKNTTLFGLYTSVGNDVNADYGLSTASTGGFSSVAPDSDPSAIAIGVRHSF